MHASSDRSTDVPQDRLSIGAEQRLWTPWRMRYVGGGASEGGCIFCRRRDADDDVASLILHRGRHAFMIMNLYPYNTGHLMLVPNEHVAGPEDAIPDALAEMAEFLPPTLRALRRVLHCGGFNIGINVGGIAGAGVADHLHEHVVPRWEGDANFMPIVASTMVLPELIPITYAKLRAEIVREFEGTTRVPCVVLCDHEVFVLEDESPRGGHLPIAGAGSEESLAEAALRRAREVTGNDAEIVGWAGSTSTEDGEVGLTLKVAGRNSAELAPVMYGRWMPVADAPLPPDDRVIVARALSRLAPVTATP